MECDGPSTADYAWHEAQTASNRANENARNSRVFGDRLTAIEDRVAKLEGTGQPAWVQPSDVARKLLDAAAAMARGQNVHCPELLAAAAEIIRWRR